MSISKINIENVRGISQREISGKIFKNIPNIIVAPNGFGKTSIATAFKCASKKTSIDISSDERFEKDEANKARILIEVDEEGGKRVLSVDENAHSNQIRREFDIFVISDLRYIKAQSQNFGNFSKAKAKMVIDPIVICDQVKSAKLPYKYSDIKNIFGRHHRHLIKLDSLFSGSPELLIRGLELVELIQSLIKTRLFNKINTVCVRLGDYDGTYEDGLEELTEEIEQLKKENTEIKKAIDLIVHSTNKSSNESLLILWQTIVTAKESYDSFTKYMEWMRYNIIKQMLSENLKDLNNSWKSPSLKETKGKLVVNMPDPTDISNGQRDVLLLMAMLYIVRFSLTKNKAILIIDEVFDYLDDANLTVAQYYISKIIDDYKSQKRAIYPIILTHLNPAFFNNYVFSNQKIIYLNMHDEFQASDSMKKLLNMRTDSSVDESLKDKIAKYLLHYSVEEFDFSDELAGIEKIRSSWWKNNNFLTYLKKEYEKYNKGEKYDPLAICGFVRISIEKFAYEGIEQADDMKKFLDIHTTGEKLDFVRTLNVKIPESFYLLKIIFDDGMHWRHDRDNLIPIVAKLSNPIIKKMIDEVISIAL